MKLNLVAKLIPASYFFIFISTEALSFFHILTRGNILILDIIFFSLLLFYLRKEILALLGSINPKSSTTIFISILLILTFIQGFGSAPSTTDAMTYHIPRILYWLQKGTVNESFIRGTHDFMPPFAEYILLHLYAISGNDRILFLSQWVAYLGLIIIGTLIAQKLGIEGKYKIYIALILSTLPIAVLQSTSTQVDMVINVLVLICLYLMLSLKELFEKKPSSKILDSRNFYYLSFLIGISIGLGFLIKTSFAFFIMIPLSLLTFFLFKDIKKTVLITAIIVSIAFLMQIRYYNQNISLYGNILGQHLSGEANTYVNERFDTTALISNSVKNIMNNIPVPIFTSQIQNLLINFHRIIGIDINDSKTNYANHTFSVYQVIYPQEDIAGNPLHLLIIFIGVVSLFRIKKYPTIKLLFLFTIISFLSFCFILKWEPYHPRLLIPFFSVSCVLSIIVLTTFHKGRIFIYAITPFCYTLALMLIILNVSHPYISYKLFYRQIQSFSKPLTSIPEAFYIKPRQMQYFNARYYWYDPYNKIINDLSKNNENKISLKLEDEFEYPFWVLAHDKGIDLKVIHQAHILITSSKDEFKKEGYTTNCYKTNIDYGYACLSKISVK